MKRCPRCSGNVFNEDDRIVCIMCGWNEDYISNMEVNQKLIGRLNDGDIEWKKPKRGRPPKSKDYV